MPSTYDPAGASDRRSDAGIFDAIPRFVSTSVRVVRLIAGGYAAANSMHAATLRQVVR